MAARDKRKHLDDLQQEAEVNMTSMIDVVFLLIIFFLCIDFRVLEAKLPAYLPKDIGSILAPQEPREQLRVGILCERWGREVARPFQAAAGKKRAYYLEDHRVRYSVGPKALDSLEELRQELERIKPESWVTDPRTRRRQLVEVVVEPGTGAVYGDVARAVDTILAAGFQPVHFGGGRGRRR